MSSSDTLIRCENVSKKFCRDLKRSLWYGVRDSAVDLLRMNRNGDGILRRDEFWANKDISFELKRGESLGLVGHNGAGKTTLLKILYGLIKPDVGHIEIKGRIGGLIALGAGFDPILTGRENIYVNGSILGLSKRYIKDKFDEIVAFSELEEFIDAPVRTYSSGMQVRLGFAVAAVLNQPDILLLDEVLAVGDIGFTIKCLNRMRELVARSAVVFVSHSMPLVTTFCNRVMVMKAGATICDATEIGEGIDCYLGQFDVEKSVSGSGEASVDKAVFRCPTTGEAGTFDVTIPHGSKLELDLELTTRKPAQIRLQIDTQSLIPVIASQVNASERDVPLVLSPGTHRITIPLGVMELNAGLYSLVVSVGDPDDSRAYCRHQGAASFRMTADGVRWGHVVRDVNAIIDKQDSRDRFVGGSIVS